MHMVANSIKMLRKHNEDIIVRCCHVIDHGRQTLLRGQAVTGDAESDAYVEKNTWEFVDIMKDLGVIYHPAKPFRPPGDEHFFHINRVLLEEIPEQDVLYIDGDTFIFGDVANVFDAYKDAGYAGYETRWAYSRGWQSDFLYGGMRPVGSGVMLWNKGNVRHWARTLPVYTERFRQGDMPLSKWLYTLHPNCLLREEFSVGYHLSYNTASVPVEIMSREHCITLHHDNDWKEFGKATIFHTYATGWKQGMNRLRGEGKSAPLRVPKRKPIPVRT
jgi:hypothetical protein